MKNLPPLCYKICENPFKNINKTCNLRISVSGEGTGREIRKGTSGFVFCGAGRMSTSLLSLHPFACKAGVSKKEPFCMFHK